MKHILRKLHIGGSHDSFDGRNQVLNSADTVAHPDPSVTSTSSGFSGWLTNARHGRRPSPNAAPPRRRIETSDHASATTLTIESPPSGGAQNSLSFNYYEEEYQVQLALALSVSNQNVVDDPESLQIRAAKRISLGRPPSPGNSPGESTSHRYWTYNVLDYSEKVVDGFYDVYGVTSEFGNVEKMPSLVDLQSTPLTDTLGYEVVLVNRAIDQDLVNLEQAALCLSVDCGMSGMSAQSSYLVQKIADLVVQHMGGPVTDANDMFRRWIARSYELRTSLNNIVLPLGCLNIGLSRHRALLFKVLADHVGIPCRLVKGSHYTGTDEGAVNIVKLESEREYIVDLMGAPGTLLPAENAAANVDFLDNTSLVEDLLSQIDRAQNVIVSDSNARENKSHHNTGELVPQINVSIRQKEKKINIPNQEQVYNNEHSNNAQDWNNRALLGQCQPYSQIAAQSFKASSSNLCCSSELNNTCAQLDDSGRAIVPFVDLPKLFVGGHPFDSRDNSTKVDSIQSINGVNNGLLTKDENEARRLNIHQRLNSGYMECWAKHVNNKQDPVLENVAEWEIQWEEIEIGERIGLGSYGEVHHGYWHGKEVAVKKFLDQDFFGDALDEFISEVRIMRRMQHPNVVLFLGAVTRPPSLSIVTEYLPRGSLFRLLHRPNCQLDERLRLKMAIDVAEGMNYLHTSNPIIVHRDLKSPNLLVDKDWVVKVCDFGLSRMKHHTFLSSKSTAGTPEWMAPEVLRNEPSNEKCDVYSFGVILWELCTLQQPWHGMNPMQVVGAVGFQDRRLEIPNNLDPAIVRVISGCWQRDPKLRPSFAELTEALKPLHRLLKD